MKRNDACGYGAILLAVFGVSGLIAVLARKARHDLLDVTDRAASDQQHKSTKSVVSSRDFCFVKVHVNVSVHADHSRETKADE